MKYVHLVILYNLYLMEQGGFVTFQINTEGMGWNRMKVTFTAPKGNENDPDVQTGLGLAGQALCSRCLYGQPNQGCNTLIPLETQITPPGSKVFGVSGCGFLNPNEMICLYASRITFDPTYEEIST